MFFLQTSLGSIVEAACGEGTSHLSKGVAAASGVRYTISRNPCWGSGVPLTTCSGFNPQSSPKYFLTTFSLHIFILMKGTKRTVLESKVFYISIDLAQSEPKQYMHPLLNHHHCDPDL